MAATTYFCLQVNRNELNLKAHFVDSLNPSDIRFTRNTLRPMLLFGFIGGFVGGALGFGVGSIIKPMLI
jgi:uncharacterized membrane protein YfcA